MLNEIDGIGICSKEIPINCVVVVVVTSMRDFKSSQFGSLSSFPLSILLLRIEVVVVAISKVLFE